jgi:uncharacterized protein (TIGR03790 family)
MKFLLIRFAVFGFALAPLLVRAGGDQVIVIYNTLVPESKSVAEHYARMRQVPEKQIYGFALTPNEEMSRAEFRDSLQKPLLEKLEADGLWKFAEKIVTETSSGLMHVEYRVAVSKIRYAVLCYGVPLKIAADPNLHELAADSLQPELRRNEAAVDSELAWLPLSKNNVTLSGPMPNRVYGATNTAMLNPTNGILLVARLDGPSAEIARGLVDKALEAERDGLWGRAYFDERGITDPGYKLGDEWISTAAKISQEIGLETTVDDKPGTFPADFPMSQIAMYAGWYANDADGPFALPKVEFMPGAFAYHLHSFSAATLRSTTQNWCGPLLAKGATCTMGCVYEPYLSFTPNVAVFLGRFASGFTFGEAAWAAQPALSWQTTVVGDPLYRPYGKPLAELHAELARTHNPLIEWSFLRLVDLDFVHGVPVARLERFVDNLPATTNSAVLTEKLGDLCEMEGKPSSAIDAYELALTRHPSPEQRIRLRLTLSDKLVAAGRENDAIENYKQLLTESPDYPGKPSVEAKMAALEQKLAATNNAPKNVSEAR